MEEPIQNTPAGIEEVSLEYEYVNSGEQYLGQMSENYAVVHGTVQLEDPSEQVIVEKQQQPLESVDNSEQPEISANFTQYDDTSHLYRCKATREDLLNSYHLSQTRYMSIYDLCPMCLDLGQLMQVGHHDSALVYLQQHASINYEQQPAQYQEGHFVLQAAEYAGGEGHVIGGIAGMQQMNPRLTRTSSGGNY